VSHATSSEIAAALYAAYFQTPVMNVHGMSSHWRAYARQSEVRVDTAGVPVAALGVGFGDMNTRRLGNTVLTPLAALLQGVSHPARGFVLPALRLTRQTTRKARLVFNQDAVRQAMTVAFLESHLRGETLRRILLIGDGYGVLGAALAHRYPSAQVVFIDLGRSLLFQALTCGRAVPEAAHTLLDPGGRFVYVPADRIDEWSRCPVDLAINIASMQEMTADVIASYFDLLRRAPAKWFYCCNRERKLMPGGEVAEFRRYPWAAGDVHVVDELCPWHQWYLAPRPPFRMAYDGAHLHRLTRLAPLDAGGRS
jgi:hypothetical protein